MNVLSVFLTCFFFLKLQFYSLFDMHECLGWEGDVCMTGCGQRAVWVDSSSFCGRIRRLNSGSEAWQHHLNPLDYHTSLYIFTDKKTDITGEKHLYLKSHS